ncbi:MAG: threonine--tRNA ligase [Ignavibacteriae bacterium]|nr:threonine--tRNA ligase [Ignavibacteriota bacterium]
MPEKIKISFPDGSVKEFDKGVSALDVAKGISEGFSRHVLMAKINGTLKDLNTPVDNDAKIVFYKFDSEEGKEVYWHTSSHIMAQAIEELYPGSKFGVGPAIEGGFYYDIDAPVKFGEPELKKIENKILEISKRDLKPVRIEMSRLEAIKYFKTKRIDPYKVEILETIAKEEDTVSLYNQGDFTDLCRGPHLPSTGKVKAVKLLSVSGSYWRGDEKRQMLQRIYGITFPSQKELDQHIKNLEEAKKRDHRKLGRELDLFFFHEVSPGAPFWLPNGMIIYREIESFSRKLHEKYEYDEISTPIIVREPLFKTSGHTTHYAENMFKIISDDEPMYLKPMNCPEATIVYSSKLRSYKDLPIRLSELGRMHRNEIRGALGGMFRVRQFTMDDAHIFCRTDQILEEITKVLQLMTETYTAFGFEPNYYLSTKPDEAMGSTEDWNTAEDGLAKALEANNLKYKVNEKDGAFYGPKIDVHIKDALNRTWQLATVQLDFNLPERFDLTYEGSDGKKHRPIMIHRAIYGSFERFVGILTEHYAGNFPVWIAPVQIAVLPLTDAQKEYAKSVYKEIRQAGFRVYLDDRSEKIGYKIRESENKKVPYMLVLGENEKQSGNISVRQHGAGDKGSFELQDFIQRVNLNITGKTSSYNF